MKPPAPCPYCQAVPATPGARYCGQCGKPLLNAITVVSPAFAAPITPTFQYRPRRLLFACFASPIIGLGLGAEPAAFFAMGLVDTGWPEFIVPLFALGAFAGLTALIAYIILSDKLSFLTAAARRRRLERVEAREAMVAARESAVATPTELDRQAEEIRRLHREHPPLWVQRGTTKTDM